MRYVRTPRCDKPNAKTFPATPKALRPPNPLHADRMHSKSEHSCGAKPETAIARADAGSSSRPKQPKHKDSKKAVEGQDAGFGAWLHAKG